MPANLGVQEQLALGLMIARVALVAASLEDRQELDAEELVRLVSCFAHFTGQGIRHCRQSDQ
uniref:hypothetical protein n=1 Tax=Prosthecobacter sp. TaxID=1965333 RepID=UPI0037842BB2